MPLVFAGSLFYRNVIPGPQTTVICGNNFDERSEFSTLLLVLSDLKIEIIRIQERRKFVAI